MWLTAKQLYLVQKSKKWWKKVFFQFIDLSTVNTLCLYKAVRNVQGYPRQIQNIFDLVLFMDCFNHSSIKNPMVSSYCSVEKSQIFMQAS